jgi:hypothetical protein
LAKILAGVSTPLLARILAWIDRAPTGLALFVPALIDLALILRALRPLSGAALGPLLGRSVLPCVRPVFLALIRRSRPGPHVAARGWTRARARLGCGRPILGPLAVIGAKRLARLARRLVGDGHGRP